MASFNGNIGTPSGGFNLKVEYSYTQDKVNNKSIISSIKGYCKKNNSSYYPYNSSKVATIKLERLNDSGSWVTVTTLSDSSSYSFNGVNTSTYLTFVSGSNISIPHKSDGKQQLRITFNVDGKLSSYYPVGSISQTDTLTTIPRASSVSCSSPYIGDNAVITIGKNATEFTSTITYEIGTIKGTLAEKTSETVLQLDTLSLKEEIYALMPNDKKISGTITCITYNGNTQIGSPTTATFNLYAVEEDCKPIVTGEVVDTNESTIALTGNSSIIIKNASKPKVTIDATPQLSSTIKSYSINLNDGQTSALQEDTFDTINSNKITVSAEDSRGIDTNTTGYIGTDTIDLTDRIIDYVKLHFNSVELSRPEGTSNEVILDCDGVWFNGNFSESTPNTLTINFQYKLSGETEWIDGGEITPTIDENKFSFDNYSLGNLFDYNQEYQFKIIATDLLMTVGDSNKEAISVPKGREVWFECEDGIGVYGHIWLNDEEIKIKQPLNNYNDGKTDSYSCDYINTELKKIKENVFSTEEQKIGTWIDGKPLYRKVMKFTNSITSSLVNQFSHGISNAEMVLIKNAWLYSPSNGVCYGLPITLYNSPTNEDKLSVKVDRTNVTFNVGTGWGDTWTKIVVLEYTKTTD